MQQAFLLSVPSLLAAGKQLPGPPAPATVPGSTAVFRPALAPPRGPPPFSSFRDSFPALLESAG